MTPSRSRSSSRSYALLMPRDPDWAFATWSLEVADYHAACERLPDGGGTAQLVLRLYSASRGGRRTVPRDLRLEGWSGTERLVLGAPGGPHELALGVLDAASGTFVAIARSGSTATPSEVVVDSGGRRRLPVLPGDGEPTRDLAAAALPDEAEYAPIDVEVIP